MKSRKSITFLFSAFWIFLFTTAVRAQGLGADALQQTGLGGSPAEAGNRLPVILGNIVRGFMGLLSLVFLVLTLYGGWLWLSARGDATKVEHAKDTLTRAIIGLVIILSAFAIASFVVARIVEATRPA
jgi:hypothetical protein